jgi:hypothetical protein
VTNKTLKDNLYILLMGRENMVLQSNVVNPILFVEIWIRLSKSKGSVCDFQKVPDPVRVPTLNLSVSSKAMIEKVLIFKEDLFLLCFNGKRDKKITLFIFTND